MYPRAKMAMSLVTLSRDAMKAIFLRVDLASLMIELIVCEKKQKFCMLTLPANLQHYLLSENRLTMRPVIRTYS